MQGFAILRAHHPGTATCSRSGQNGALPAGGTAPFQSMTVAHLPGGGGPLSILPQSRCRFTSSVITLNSQLNLPMASSYGSAECTACTCSLDRMPGIRHRGTAACRRTQWRTPAPTPKYAETPLCCRVAECRLDLSDMTPSNISILCRSVLSPGSQSAALFFHKRHSMSSSLSPCLSGLIPCLFAPKFLLVFYFLAAFCVCLDQTNPAFGMYHNYV